jgi:cysteinyl-tRNA synthetase
VGFYCCGPTVQNSPHIGHARTFISFDMVRRALTWLGWQVRYVRNVTDIDDKIIVRAREHGEDSFAFACRYADEFNRAMGLIGVLPPDVEPRVTGHIPQIVAIIETLIARGMAYASAGDVYYAVDRFAPYGKLSGQSIDDLQAGARVEPGEQKRAPLDFALWKAAKPGEPSWPSPWGPGRPGWHIECSAMALEHLGERFDLHAGGKDLIFPHHENEIAQSQGACGEGTFARHWLHAGFLNLNEEKMSKSLGNVLGVADMAARFGGETMRLYFLGTHYRSPLNFEVQDGADGGASFPGLEDAQRRLDYFYTTLARLEDAGTPAAAASEAGPLVPEAEGLRQRVTTALEDDFNSSLVIAELGEAAKAANKLLDEPKAAAKDVRRRSLARLSVDLVDIARGALGLLTRPPREYLAERRVTQCARRGIDTAWVAEQLAAREAARAAKDFTRADAVRGELKARGVAVMDTPRGVDWRVLDA